jgi:ADP-heptose:LPS heptosyltransferase
VGDVARTVPAASCLRAVWPGAHIAWLVEPAAASLLVGQPWLDEVLVFPRPALAAARRALGSELARFLARLRGRRFDLVVDFHAVLRSALLALATGCRRRVSYARPFGRELAWALATDRARLAPARMSRFERNEGLVRFLGVEAKPSPRPLRVDPGAVVRMRERLGAGPAPVAIHPGTSDRTPHKRFSAQVYAQVAKALHAELGIPSIATFGPARDDRRLAEAVVAAAPEAARLAPETPTLADLAALLACSRLAIGPDTGPLHVASLVGTPVVQLLGPTDPVENAPWPATPSRTLRALPGALSVARRSGRRGAAAARRAGEIPPGAIVAAARELLGAAPTSGAAARELLGSAPAPLEATRSASFEGAAAARGLSAPASTAAAREPLAPAPASGAAVARAPR